MRPLGGGRIFLFCVRRSDSTVMLVGLWEMAKILSFGRMCRWVVCSLEIDLIDYLICLC